MIFHKMHGLGNDFIVINDLDNKQKDWKDLSIKMCDRHFGIGADGIILIQNSNTEDIKMSIINSDGSIAEMCGNGIRCFAKYVYELKIVNKEVINIETLAGTMVANLNIKDSKVEGIKINMGKPIFEKLCIPFEDKRDNLLYEINIDKKTYKASTILMGVPHTILLVDEIDLNEVVEYGRKIEVLDIFPAKSNVNFVKVVDKKNIEIRTWERGAGLTLACGTGTCASVVSCFKNGLTNNKVTAHLTGGKMIIEYDGNEVFMEGPAQFVYKGEYYF